MHETMTKTTDDLRNSTVLWAEDIDRIGRMLEGGQSFGFLKKFNANRSDIRHKEIERLIEFVVRPDHVFVALHAFFPGQPFEQIQIDARASPNQPRDIKAGGSSNRRRNIVKILWIDQNKAGAGTAAMI